MGFEPFFLNLLGVCKISKKVSNFEIAKEEAKIMIVEPTGVLNTGDAEGELTADNNQWV